MKLPSFRRLFTQDFPDKYSDLIEKLSTTLNNGIETLYNLGNKNITLSENVSCTVKDVIVSVSSNGLPKTSTSFILDEAVKTRLVTGLTVLRIENLSNATNLPPYHPYIDWIQSNNSIIINRINGLPANDNFRVRLVAYN